MTLPNTPHILGKTPLSSRYLMAVLCKPPNITRGYNLKRVVAAILYKVFTPSL